MQDDPAVLDINNQAGLVTPDGMPEVWLGRLAGHEEIEKVYAPDIMMDTFEASVERGYRHFLYGGKEGVAEKLSRVLRQRYPGIEIVGTYCPLFRPLTEREVADISAEINRSGADVVWCGLGCPKQERWMAQFRPLVQVPVLIGVGAGFDFLSGEKPLAPKWIQQSGLEWFYRMVSEPKRLVRRYASVVPRFIWLNLLEKLGLSRRPSRWG
jgi:N-acetylglucosaminyldiphosphoundecaprenol N-acetyl-beta-D-mannosaminyltransferase